VFAVLGAGFRPPGSGDRSSRRPVGATRTGRCGCLVIARAFVALGAGALSFAMFRQAEAAPRGRIPRKELKIVGGSALARVRDPPAPSVTIQDADGIRRSKGPLDNSYVHVRLLGKGLLNAAPSAPSFHRRADANR